MVALQAAWNHQHAYPGQKSLVAAVEVCSAALYRDGTVEAAVGEAIFGDGAAALCLAWEGAGFEVPGHRTLIRSEHIGLTGFEFPEGRRRLVLSKDLPVVGAQVLEELVASLLEEHAVPKSEVRFWILHSAGRKVLDVAKERLGLSEDDIRFSRDVFRTCGNMSSPTVLFVLDGVMASGQPRPGDFAVMAAMGAGFAAAGFAGSRNAISVAGLSFNGYQSSFQPGWTIGAGVEYMIMPRVSAKAEYLYTSTGSDTYFAGTPFQTYSGVVGPSHVWGDWYGDGRGEAVDRSSVSVKITGNMMELKRPTASAAYAATSPGRG